ncbi:MAG TPA: GNAT family N-acetyltransferase, partial [Dehalococcoidia bacterium]|nr:GNAT family N-acetyltransferase [Dehalococcoidia bacterium]
MKVDRARVSDAAAIHQMVNHFADKGEMLPRALSDIYENVRDYFVVRDNEQVTACAALHVNWLDLAEIRSLAVDESMQKKGVGSLLIQACLDDAKNLAIPTVF